jgi:NAD-dependent dihydropyrimidine dehydrogenase PreA subunit
MPPRWTGIHPSKKESGFEVSEQLYIDPVECIDCGACVPVCPVSAMFAADDLPDNSKCFAEITLNTTGADTCSAMGSTHAGRCNRERVPAMQS